MKSRDPVAVISEKERDPKQPAELHFEQIDEVQER